MIEKTGNLSYEISEIKKRNRFGLIKISEHAISRMKERGINEEIILNCISKRETTIIQHHSPKTYHNNKDELFVLYAKVIVHGKQNPIHIVIAKEIRENDGVVYRVVTCYIPSKSLFYAHGRKLRTN